MQAKWLAARNRRVRLMSAVDESAHALVSDAGLDIEAEDLSSLPYGRLSWGSCEITLNGAVFWFEFRRDPGRNACICGNQREYAGHEALAGTTAVSQPPSHVCRMHFEHAQPFVLLSRIWTWSHCCLSFDEINRSLSNPKNTSSRDINRQSPAREARIRDAAASQLRLRPAPCPVCRFAADCLSPF